MTSPRCATRSPLLAALSLASIGVGALVLIVGVTFWVLAEGGAPDDIDREPTRSAAGWCFIGGLALLLGGWAVWRSADRTRPRDDANLLGRSLERSTSGVWRSAGDDPSISDQELLEQRNRWFEAYTSQLHVFAPPEGGPYTCPCCGRRTLPERGGYDICGECGWEDDGQDDHDADVVRGGPNGSLSLTNARQAYEAAGGVRSDHQAPSAAK
jgi:hypothetical protein